jgi:hypothetical protein
MEEITETNQDFQKFERRNGYSRSFRTKKRNYYFDVRTTKFDDTYITITENKKRQLRDGNFVNNRYTIFLYKEDFDQFLENFQDVLDYAKLQIRKSDQNPDQTQDSSENAFSDITFEDLEGAVFSGEDPVNEKE